MTVPLVSILMYGLLIIVDSDKWPNAIPLRNIRLRYLIGLDFDLSRSLNIKSNGAVGLHKYNFLLSVIEKNVLTF